MARSAASFCLIVDMRTGMGEERKELKELERRNVLRGRQKCDETLNEKSQLIVSAFM